jgi:hypothetical protein
VPLPPKTHKAHGMRRVLSKRLTPCLRALSGNAAVSLKLVDDMSEFVQSAQNMNSTKEIDRALSTLWRADTLGSMNAALKKDRKLKNLLVQWASDEVQVGKLSDRGLVNIVHLFANLNLWREDDALNCLSAEATKRIEQKMNCEKSIAFVHRLLGSFAKLRYTDTEFVQKCSEYFSKAKRLNSMEMHRFSGTVSGLALLGSSSGAFFGAVNDVALNRFEEIKTNSEALSKIVWSLATRNQRCIFKQQVSEHFAKVGVMHLNEQQFSRICVANHYYHFGSGVRNGFLRYIQDKIVPDMKSFSKETLLIALNFLYKERGYIGKVNNAFVEQMQNLIDDGVLELKDSDVELMRKLTETSVVKRDS